MKSSFENVALEKLVAGSRSSVMTPAEQELQRRSFAAGNVGLANPRVTREVVDRAAATMSEVAATMSEVAARADLADLDVHMRGIAGDPRPERGGQGADGGPAARPGGGPRGLPERRGRRPGTHYVVWTEHAVGRKI